MKRDQLVELLLQPLEHEMGGVEVYQTAVECAVRPDLREEWEKYLAQTRTHVELLEQVCLALDIDSATRTPGRDVVRTVGMALVEAMRKASMAGDPAAAQLVACECVVLAETKDHLDWELLSKCVDKLSGKERKALKAAVEEVEDQEDEHLYH